MIPALPHHYYRMWEVKHNSLIPGYAPNGMYIFQEKIPSQIAALDFRDSVSPYAGDEFFYIGYDGFEPKSYQDSLIESQRLISELYLSGLKLGDRYYRRQSNGLNVEFVDDPTSTASVELIDGDPTCRVSSGLIHAIDDLAHTIFADPQSPLMDYVGKRPTSVLRSNDHTSFDSQRYWDYQEIDAIGRSQKICTPYFRVLSGSIERQRLADFCSMLAIYWIIAHEDAHVYLGHLGFFNKKIGDSDRARSLFNELVNELKGGSNDEHRSAELDADRNASMRLVDEFFHLPYFTELPACVKFQNDGYSQQ